MVVANLREKMEPPASAGIQFTVRENNWLDRLARAMQEALARLCGQSINQIKGTNFEYYPMRDAMGQPLEGPLHPELRRQTDDLSFMMYDRQKELDNARAISNHKTALAIQKDNTITRLLKNRKKSRRSLDKKQCIIARLRSKISALEYIIQKNDMDLDSTEDEGEDITGHPYSYLSDDDDYLEDRAMEFITDEEDYVFINDEKEEEATNSEE